MFYILLVVLAVGLVAFVWIRQARHPVAHGRHPTGESRAQQQGKFRGMEHGGGGG